MNRARIASLDGLRAISILLVVLGHLSGTRGAPEWLGFFEPYANFGVRVFFVISGFLITTLLLEEYRESGTISLRQFYKRRCYRIFPAAYVFAIAVSIIWFRSLSGFDLATMFTYTVNYNIDRPWVVAHLWSLGVEEQFYLLWPLLLVIFFRHRIGILVATILITPFSNALLLHFGFPGVGNYFWTVADALAMGCLLAVMHPLVERNRRLIMRRSILIFSVLALLLPLICLKIRGLATLGGYTMMHAGIALTIAHCVRVPYWLLNNKIMIKMGVLSYSFYLWQQPFLDRHSSAVYASFPTNIILACLAAGASYYLVERPMLQYRDKTRKSRPISNAEGPGLAESVGC